MSVAHKFLEELKSGNINEAIETIEAGLKEKTHENIKEKRKEILESYGFASVDEGTIKVGDKVEIAHVDPNTTEPSFKGDTSVGEVVEIKGDRALIYDTSEGESDWSDISDIRKIK